MAVRFPVTPQHIDTVEPDFKYSNISHLTQVGKYGEDPGDLSFPRGVAIHENSNNIYVTEYNPVRVSIFSESGEFLDSFTHEKMKSPCGIAIRYDSVFVSDVLAAFGVFHFKIESDLSLDSTLVCMGYEKGVSNSPRQLAVSDQGEIFIADCDLQKVRILDESLHYQRSIKHEHMLLPVDVKLTNNEVFVLTDNSPCVIAFSHAGEILRSFITCGKGKEVSSPSFFCMDATHNLFINDFGAKCLKIFSPDGKPNNSIEVDDVWNFRLHGIVLTKQCKIVLITHTEPFQLQIHSF